MKILLFFTVGWVSEALQLEGLRCSSESVEQANSAHLHSILSELADSTFFRLVHVDSEGFCPLTPASEPSTCGTVPPTSPFDIQPRPETSLCNVETEQQFASSVVKKISTSEKFAQQEFPRDNECVVEGTFAIRPDYWLDICQGVTAGEFVNLRLNPERNTGYNGSLIWEEMHAAANKLGSMEGKILARILNGYHTSVTAQVMANYFPPDWKPNEKRLVEKIVENPSYVEDLKFAFVVMARSLFKIRDLLYEYSFTTGNVTEDSQTRSLVRHLLDSAVLSSCESVLSGFDESVLFTEQESVSLAATEFKKTFRRISSLVNCVTCKRCKLHASVAMHGIGAGLKILLSPREVVMKSLSRDDLVALVNTVHMLSDSLQIVSLSALGRKPTHDHNRQVLLEFVRDHRSLLTKLEQDALVDAILRRDEKISVLAKVFMPHPSFLRHALISLGIAVPDAVIIGGGLAGLVTAISVAERGGSVVILEKQSSLGGNSAKASSGINSIRSNSSDDLAEFLEDTLRSQNGHGDSELAKILISKANESVSWLERVSGVNLSSLGQLGGHRKARTWKPEHGVVGAELMAALIGEVKKSYAPFVKVITNGRVVGLGAQEVKYINKEGQEIVQPARAVVLASGGFGFDFEGLLRAYRPDLAEFPTTLGKQTTGDGIKLAVSLGADLVDMEYVQLHPTGFIDPSDRSSKVKVLAAEVLRGIGGLLLNQHGDRFVNELSTRKVVTEAMLKDSSCGDRDSCWFWLVIPGSAEEKAPNLLSIYQNRGLLKKFETNNLPCPRGEVDESEAFYFVGQVTPVVHYTMGGVRVDSHGRVLKVDGSVIPNLFAVGEVAGGVHGENRLGGNSLLECTVFGRIIGGKSLDVNQELTPSHFPRKDDAYDGSKKIKSLEVYSVADVENHKHADDCWTVIRGKVYDLSRYADEHPGGAHAIRESCGKDSTTRFLTAHTEGLLADVGFEPIGSIHNYQPSV